MKIKSVLFAVCATTLLLEGSRLLAQDSTPTPAPAITPAASSSGSAPTDRFAEFRQRMNDRLKTTLKASDDEWAVIQPLLERVETVQARTITAGRFGFGGRRGGGGGPGAGNGGANATGTPGPESQGNRPNRFSSPEADALRAALDSEGTSSDEIKTRLQALRESRKKAAADLTQAREDLKKVLTFRQEAVLVEMGLLD